MARVLSTAPMSRRCDDIVALGVIAKAGADGASASAIGNALLHPRANNVPLHHREALGLATGAALMRRGLATVTRGNRFVLKANAPPKRHVTHASHASPPVTLHKGA
jgi:hypothetical protein